MTKIQTYANSIEYFAIEELCAESPPKLKIHSFPLAFFLTHIFFVLKTFNELESEIVYVVSIPFSFLNHVYIEDFYLVESPMILKVDE